MDVFQNSAVNTKRGINRRQSMNEMQEKEMKSLDIRQQEDLINALNLAESSVYKTYLENLNLFPLVDCPPELQKKDLNELARFFKVERFVHEKNENNRDKLVSVFHAVASCGGSILILIDSDGEKIRYYIGAKVPADASVDALDTVADVLEKSYTGNFPGTTLEVIHGGAEINKITYSAFANKLHSEQQKRVCTITGIAGLRSKEENSEKLFVQGIEKLVDSMRGETYSLLLIADPVSQGQIDTIKQGYETLYSELIPFAESELTFGQSEGKSVSKSLTDGLSKSINTSVTDTFSHTTEASESHTEGSFKSATLGVSAGINEALSQSHTEGTSHTKGTSYTEGTSHTKETSLTTSEGKSGAGIGSIIGGIAGTIFGILVPVVGSVIGAGIGSALGGTIGGSFSGQEGQSEGQSITKSVSKSVTESLTKSLSDTVGRTLGKSLGVNASGTAGTSESDTTGTSESDTTSEATTKGKTNTATVTKGKTDTTEEGTNKSLQLKFENKSVKNLLEKIDLQLERINACADLGMWNCSVYCLADTAATGKITASAYQSLLRGENSSIETGSLTEWTQENTLRILPYLEKMHHPKLLLGGNEITPTSLISGAELSIHAGIPRTSVGGLPVVEMASFGREVTTHWNSVFYENEISLGNIYHMGKEEALPVNLSGKSLTAHTFITGSTGSGKSNTVYQLLDEIKHTGAKFLIVESAKGEYKHILGNKKYVSVYGTNPSKTPLLRINPFKFPDDIHVLEHLDRLVEIFNVCWPMYAAMPAILKEAFEAAYQEAGWDLRLSTNSYEQKLYPTFADVRINIRRIIENSEYSDENKGNYKGALITRIASLANGLNGMIFVNDGLSDEELFDKNVIADLSRVGSMETKSLIMGLLVMKLHEYRQTSGQMNAELRHVTVLEEAHNLLKRTSAEQSSETANLLGKSVEMLANAIAEMRTYGEGFIIADQSPGLLDMSVIRNTNTKIILRLPDESDRQLVGKAAGLNDDQIVELARLPCGVASVYQNDWIQPILCKIKHYKTPDALYQYEQREPNQAAENEAALNELKKRITCYLLSNVVKEPVEEDTASLRETVLKSALDNSLKTRIISSLSKYARPPENTKMITDIIADMYPYPQMAVNKALAGFSISNEWAEMLYDDITPRIDGFNEKTQRVILNCIIVEIALRNNRLRELPRKWNELKWDGYKL
jgi:hypothetical protein